MDNSEARHRGSVMCGMIEQWEAPPSTFKFRRLWTDAQPVYVTMWVDLRGV